MSRLGAAFYAFALILLPVLAFVGVVTLLRLVQSSIEDLAYAHRIGLLRSFYLRLAPELEPYIVVVRGTRSAVPSIGEPLAPGARQLTLGLNASRARRWWRSCNEKTPAPTTAPTATGIASDWTPAASSTSPARAATTTLLTTATIPAVVEAVDQAAISV
jgi:hypothetical protein